tara:strand:+ start:1496 stop:2197 length:702 start_codon:yes stop_codon:yes gene_type:complete
MAVVIDDVYQKVLALANKEQRGYITPQEFNLMANKAQLEIFDSYFHNYKTIDLKPKTSFTHGDELDMLEEKISTFRTSSSVIVAQGSGDINFQTISPSIYRLKSVTTPNGQATQMNEKDVITTETHPLTKSNKKRPIYTRLSNGITIYPTFTEESICVLVYYKRPTSPQWAYVVANGRALYNSNLSVNFELHPSEEEILVSKILQLSGVIIMKPEIIQAGGGMEQATKQEQND